MANQTKKASKGGKKAQIKALEAQIASLQAALAGQQVDIPKEKTKELTSRAQRFASDCDWETRLHCIGNALAAVGSGAELHPEDRRIACEQILSLRDLGRAAYCFI